MLYFYYYTRYKPSIDHPSIIKYYTSHALLQAVSLTVIASASTNIKLFTCQLNHPLCLVLSIYKLTLPSCRCFWLTFDLQLAYIIFALGNTRMSNPYRNSNCQVRRGNLQIEYSVDLKLQRSSGSTKSQKSTSAYVKIYPFVLAVLFVKRIRKCVKKRWHRAKILEQWLLTQKSYYLDLVTSFHSIQKPMEQQGVVQKSDIAFLFPELSGMMQLSELMIKALEKNLKASSFSSTVGSEINKFVGSYKLYGKYFSSHAKRLQLLSKISQQKQAQLKAIESNMQMQLAKKQSRKENQTIKDCMDQPLYRLFKYVLLLKQYIKKMPSSLPDYSEVNKCLSAFLEINNYNNQLMRKIEENQKKLKLARLFGGIIGEDRSYVTEMEARTIDHQVRLYIFSDVVLLTRIQSNLGSEKEYKLGVFEINEFAYIESQDNLKYFRNIVILISNLKCIHLFFDYEDVKIEFLKCLHKILKQVRIKKHSQRKIERSMVIPLKRTPSEMEREARNMIALSYFKVEIMGFEVRSNGSISNDTVYQTRFMIPYYYEDELNLQKQMDAIAKRKSIEMEQAQKYNKRLTNHLFQKNENSGKQQLNKYCINQKIEIHFKALEQLYPQMQVFANNRLPEIDLISKDVNIYATGTRKTKPFEIRKFLIEDLFNSAFRNVQVIENLSWLANILRINQSIWHYALARNHQLIKLQNKSYGFNHCQLCNSARIQSIEQFEQIRDYYLSQNHRDNKEADKYCVNFFNLLRMMLLRLNSSSFNTIERVLLYEHYREGRIDYPFLMHNNVEKYLKMIRIYLASVEERYIEVSVDTKTTVGEVLQEIGAVLQLQNTFDFDLMVSYGQKTRLLDRDQYMCDLIKTLDIKFEQCKIKNNVIKKRSKGILESLKSLSFQLFGSENQVTKVYFLKSTYLSKTLECASYAVRREKLHLEVEKIFWKIKQGLIRLTLSDLLEMVAIYYCIKEFSNIFIYKVKVSNKILERVMPDEYIHMFQYEQEFKKNLAVAIENEKSLIQACKFTIDHLYDKVLTLSYAKSTYRTYFIEVQPKQFPNGWLLQEEVLKSYLLGVNYKNVVIARNELNATDLEYSISMYSIFLTYESLSFRFDGKMLHHFSQMLRKYQSLQKQFLQLLA